MRIFIGNDLGQASDYTALTVVVEDDGIYHLRYLDRFRGIPYPSIVERVATLVKRLTAKNGRSPVAIGNGMFLPVSPCRLIVDATGVGRAVVDMFLAADIPCRIVPITITAGSKVTSDGRGGYHVPKRDLISSAQCLLQSRRLFYDRKLPLIDVLIKELQAFTVRITAAANETFGEWRTGKHDDCVLAPR